MVNAPSVSVDVASIAGLSHACTGCKGTRGCCCASYEVCVSAREMKAIIGVMPLLAEFCPALKARAGFANVFEEVDGGGYCIDTDEKGLCVFAYVSNRKIRCSVHSAARKLGLAPSALKPFVCTLWPLALSEAPGRCLSVCEDARSFHCCRGRGESRGKTVAGALLGGIGDLFGEAARREVIRASGRGLRRTVIHPGRGRRAGSLRGTGIKKPLKSCRVRARN